MFSFCNNGFKCMSVYIYLCKVNVLMGFRMDLHVHDKSLLYSSYMEI